MAEISRRVRIAAWILGGFVAIVVLLIALLHTPPARRYALKQAVAILGEQGIKFDASRLSYNLLELKANLVNVEIRSVQQPDLPPALRADSAQVDLSLRKLLQGSYDIEDATIRNPQVHVVVTEDGRDNIPRPPKKEQTSQTKTDYLIDKLLIEGGNLRYEDRRQKVDAQIPIERLTVDGNPATGNHDIQFTARRGGLIAFESRTMPLNTLRASALLEDNAVQVNKLELGMGDSTVALSGRVNNFDNPQFDIKADTKLALGSLVELAGVKQTVRGDVNVALAATGPLGQLKATARLDGQNITVDKLDQLDIKAEAAYDAAASRVRFESLNVVSPSGTIRGQADLALNAGAGQSTANIAASGLDLGRLSRTFDLPVQIASRADAKIAARWPELQFEKAAGNANVSLRATGATGRDVVPVSGSLNATTQGNRI
ncbi:MAG TPA: hypothetical protein VEQ63_01660, partial [Bryobacteraceae bacterium]|nr:hypothetical protein [Bryobacteraceae bacterium]